MTHASRRNFLKLAGLAGTSALTVQAQAIQQPNTAKAKNLIFLVADGMSTGALAMVNAWNKQVNEEPLEWFKLYQSGHYNRSFQDTASANSVVTDSAAAASAWGCGHRVDNGKLNITPDGKSHKAIFQYAKEAGKATGVVSTCRVTHATPAGFLTQSDSRNAEDAIADKYLKDPIDVYLGGGLRHFKRDDADLAAQFAQKGYTLATDARELKAAESSQKVLGLFSHSHFPYMVDRENDPRLKDIPGLETIFASALKMLGPKPEGFVLQVESGRIDHAGHDNDAGAMLHEMLEFDRCIPIALEYIKKHPDTLLILTTDHGTGGCQLNGQGRTYELTHEGIDRLSTIKGSIASLRASYRERGRFDGVAFERITGIPAPAGKVAAVEEILAQPGRYFSSSVVSVFGKELRDRTGVGWTSHQHTAEQVEFLAMGPGSDRFPPFLENREVFGVLRKVLAI